MVNKVFLIGHLGSDPKVSYTQSGTSVATLSVATNRRVKDKAGDFQDETEWHRVIVWDKAADFCGKFMAKGSKIYVEGRLQTRKWKDNDGVERYTTEIVANETKSLSPSGESGGKQAPGEQAPMENGGGFVGSEEVPF